MKPSRPERKALDVLKAAALAYDARDTGWPRTLVLAALAYRDAVRLAREGRETQARRREER